MMTESDGWKVEIYLYDLSMGMARLYSQMILGRTLEAIYHTSIVVYGQEYYFGQGISVSKEPGKTPYGSPIEVKVLGTTFVPPDIFLEYLHTLSRTKFQPHKYHLLDQNCNHFTETVSEFLIGPDISKSVYPAGVKEMITIVEETPLGQMIRPWINSIMGPRIAQLEQEANSDIIHSIDGRGRGEDFLDINQPFLFKDASWTALEKKIIDNCNLLEWKNANDWIQIAKGNMELSRQHCDHLVKIVKDDNQAKESILFPFVDAIRLNLVLSNNNMSSLPSAENFVKELHKFVVERVNVIKDSKDAKVLAIMTARLFSHIAAALSDIENSTGLDPLLDEHLWGEWMSINHPELRKAALAWSHNVFLRSKASSSISPDTLLATLSMLVHQLREGDREITQLGLVISSLAGLLNYVKVFKTDAFEEVLELAKVMELPSLLRDESITKGDHSSRIKENINLIEKIW